MSSPTGTVTRVMMIQSKSCARASASGPREREQRLAGAGLADQRDEVDVGVHQHVEREILLAVARDDAQTLWRWWA